MYAPLTPIPPQRITVPIRSVFAEAVVGACNSCEVKDESRFWRWEESPGPDQPLPIESASISNIPSFQTTEKVFLNDGCSSSSSANRSMSGVSGKVKLTHPGN